MPVAKRTCNRILIKGCCLKTGEKFREESTVYFDVWIDVVEQASDPVSFKIRVSGIWICNIY